MNILTIYSPHRLMLNKFKHRAEFNIVFHMVSPENRGATGVWDARYSEFTGKKMLFSNTSLQSHLFIFLSLVCSHLLDKAVWSLNIQQSPLPSVQHGLSAPLSRVVPVLFLHQRCSPLWISVSVMVCLGNVIWNPCSSPPL